MTDDDPQRPGKVYMMLTMSGDDLDPEEITRALKLTPTRSFRRGDAFTAGGRSHPRAYGSWMWTTENSVRSQELVDHSKCLRELFSPVKEQLRSLRSRAGIRTAVAFWWEPTDGPVGFTFPSSELTALAEICDEFDFYFA